MSQSNKDYILTNLSCVEIKIFLFLVHRKITRQLLLNTNFNQILLVIYLSVIHHIKNVLAFYVMTHEIITYDLFN